MKLGIVILGIVVNGDVTCRPGACVYFENVPRSTSASSLADSLRNIPERSREINTAVCIRALYADVDGHALFSDEFLKLAGLSSSLGVMQSLRENIVSPCSEPE